MIAHGSPVPTIGVAVNWVAPPISVSADMSTFGAEQIGRVLGGRYRIVSPVGVGASATVYLADDVQLRRKVAIKILHPSLAEDPGFLKRFRAEAQAAAALSHPNILAVYDWGEEGGTPYLVTEYLGGGSLRAMLDVGRNLTPSQALLIGLETARGLDYAHKRGFIHRDVKPANLLFGEDGRLRIADFGLARALAEAAWTEPAGVVLGTARYTSPEQARGLSVTGKSDIYSLALVLIESVTGQVPFAGDTIQATLMGRLDQLMPVSADLGPLASVLERAGRPDPAERYDAAELGRALVLSAERLPRPEPLPLVTDAGGRIDAFGMDRAGTADPPTAIFDPQPAPPADIPDRGPMPDLRQLRETPSATGLSSVPDLSGVPDREAAVLGTPASGAPVLGDPLAPSPTTAPANGLPYATDEPDDDDDGGRPRRRWLLGVVALILLAAVAAGAIWVVKSRGTTTYVVPDLVGQTEQAARAAVAEFEFIVETQTTRVDGTEQGEIIQQFPTSNAELAKGGVVTLVISDGPTLVEVPDVANLVDGEAKAILEDTGLLIGGVTYEINEFVPANVVVSVAQVGQQLPKGSAVDVVISNGPAPRTIPSITGGGYDAAVAALESVQLLVTRVDQFSDSVPAGIVISTDPPSGSQVARETTVTVVVSKGPDLVTVPDVAGKTGDEAAAILQGAGFALGEISGQAGQPVLNTDPRIGTQVKRGSVVDIILG